MDQNTKGTFQELLARLSAGEQVTPEELAAMSISGASGFVNDLGALMLGGVSLRPVARTVTANGIGVDLSSGDGQAHAIVIGGAWTDGTHAISLEESNNDATGDEHAAADAYTAVADTVSITNITGTSLQIVTFRHRAPWVRAVATVSGGPATGAVYAVVIVASKRRP